uniref:BPTI/Kunitz inhibitor domain-containing protein n=1 Tax=Mastacembelus armatus TaxID=205130 RepID=A0A7N8XBJ8_9TELE
KLTAISLLHVLWRTIYISHKLLGQLVLVDSETENEYDLLQLQQVQNYPCLLPPDAGGCQSYTVMWHFDKRYGKCSAFWYGGCGGNTNRFETRTECQRASAVYFQQLDPVKCRSRGSSEDGDIRFFVQVSH